MFRCTGGGSEGKWFANFTHCTQILSRCPKVADQGSQARRMGTRDRTDIWSFGLALISVAFGRYPLPTQDGFFGLVDSVANEKFLELPADQYSPECRSFIQECIRIDPDERPSAEELLSHPFITKYSPEETLTEWARFIEERSLCEERLKELESLADASDYGVSFLSTATPAFSRRNVSIEPVQMSLQLGLANVLGMPVHKVYEQFEVRQIIGGLLLLPSKLDGISW
uniref:mitogen-activated protein kinase kinase n=1 Tax=Globisporangium ultimum (strain ATCC 200006 / CBS 805.95 / DAOM BR144) TaxID=431595 RepID=K3X4A5_GLOUD